MGNLVEIARFYDPEEAYCAKSFLFSNGIDSFIQNDHHLTMAPWLRIALDGYGLQIMASSEEDAKTLLGNINSVQLETVEGNPADTMQQGRKPNWLWLPLAVWSGIPFVPKSRDGFGLWKQAGLSLLVAMVLCYWVWFFNVYFGLF